jgi:ubiquinone/menaquinone biosynthesis C-methylase UbiE
MYLAIGIGIFLIALVYLFVDQEIYFYEGVHLGPRIQGWLYDHWAAQYDKGKQASQARDPEMLAQPLLEALKDVPEPFVLDVATGTGRMPFALLSQPGFKGHIIALDISVGMLARAAAKLTGQREGVTLLKYTNLPLPFPDNAFDAVSCMEALEMMPEMEAPLAEFVRVLRPGGVFISSRGTEASGRKHKIRSAENFTKLLEQFGFEGVQISPWWKWFDRVLAHKPGERTPAGFHNLTEVLRCPVCGKTELTGSAQKLCCACGAEILFSPEDIVMYQL